jgi:hypothetical protein
MILAHNDLLISSAVCCFSIALETCTYFMFLYTWCTTDRAWQEF